MVSSFQIAKVAGAIALLLGSLTLPASASAQSLGELVLESVAAEPLRAAVPLLDSEDLSASEVQVGLASAEDYGSRGLPRSAQLDTLSLTVGPNPNGGLQIDIVSVQPIDDEAAVLLLDVRWPAGRALREYSLAPAQSGQAPLPGTSRAGAAAGTSAVTLAPPQTAAAAAPPSAITDQYTVQSGDTTFSIAERTRPSSEVSVQQMMVAIQRANEEAFVNNDINRILTGRVLRIPTVDEISIIDREAAVAQIALQTQVLGNQPLSGAAGPATPAAPRDELTLLSGDSNAGASTAGDPDAVIAALEAELMLAEETLDRVRLENLELTNRLSALQEQIDLLNNIIAIEDQRIAELQASLRAQVGIADGADTGGSAVSAKTLALVGAGLALAVAAVVGVLVRRRRQATARAESAGEELLDLSGDDSNTSRPGGMDALWAAVVSRKQKAQSAESELWNSAVRPGDDLRSEPAELADVVVDEEYEDLASQLSEIGEEAAKAAKSQERPSFEPAEGSPFSNPAFAPLGQPEPRQARIEDSLSQAFSQNTMVGSEERLSADVADFGSAAPARGATEVSAPFATPGQMSRGSESVGAALGAATASREAAELPPLAASNLAPEAAPMAWGNEPGDRLTASADRADDEQAFDANLEQVAAADTGVNSGSSSPEWPQDYPADSGWPRTENTAVEAAAQFAAPLQTPDSAATPPFGSSDWPQSEPVARELPGSAPAVVSRAPAVEPDLADLDSLKIDLDDLESFTFDDSTLDGEGEAEGALASAAEPSDIHDARLDLAVAYEAMGDIDGALEILDEVMVNGQPAQMAEARRLKTQWLND
ncbi:MAG: FimV/HubP family polar landmark protein [Pseudohongiellaceae bacterium]